jgi:hypothetical protein
MRKMPENPACFPDGLSPEQNGCRTVNFKKDFALLRGIGWGAPPFYDRLEALDIKEMAEKKFLICISPGARGSGT